MGVNWSRYATQYDLMAELNPAYDALVEHCASRVQSWGLKPGDVIADFGGATGRISTRLAALHPDVRVLHVDRDPVMLECAVEKAKKQQLRNWEAVNADLEGAELASKLPLLAGAVSVHVIYALADPPAFIRRVHSWLASSARFYACNLGRTMSTLDWGWYLTRHSIAKRGLVETVRLLLSTRVIRQENARVTVEQRAGRYWTHTMAQYRQVFLDAGYVIDEEDATLYRGYDDLVIARKP